MNTFADHVIQFNRDLAFADSLPADVQLLNPFKANDEIMSVTTAFYKKFYDDYRKRTLILGINPGRLGGGATGIPFTDSKRLTQLCDIPISSISTHEPSSVFVYEVIRQYGGVEAFYSRYFINSVCPLGFIRLNGKGNWINCNYYDDERLFAAVKPFIVSSLKKQIDFGVDTGVCFVLGKKNATYFETINAAEKLFDTFIALDHPRFIEQYQSKRRQDYINHYLKNLA
ncbi:uracil-DNA glycosylase family protein [Parapedobacter koreensis]|uniref:Uracil-DNA glycosylase-like domain-containing protein n=1 Tax=Parapedobacter koreensis TaxID=332977 RepID=A0A1H7P1H4_9SPHI|nr:uracil-DNA glycosylase family protein [Parapedobacter koreensis]SEL29449.1 protein of unknown function [Parapedobacter koreensis]